MLTDPIADMLSRIRNGYLARKKVVEVSNSRMKLRLAKILSSHKLIGDVKILGKLPRKKILITLLYKNNQPVLTKIIKVSKPGRRVYKASKDLPKVLSGLGIAVVSTSKGIITASEAKKLNLGGEIICKAW